MFLDPSFRLLRVMLDSNYFDDSKANKFDCYKVSFLRKHILSNESNKNIGEDLSFFPIK